MVCDGANVLVEQVKRVHDLAINIKLELRNRGIADAHGARPAISLPVFQDLLGNPGVATNAGENRKWSVRAVLLGCVFLKPIDEPCCFGSEANAEKGVNRESRVARPSVAVIPVPSASNYFRQTGGGSGDDRSRRMKSKKLQGQR